MRKAGGGGRPAGGWAGCLVPALQLGGGSWWRRASCRWVDDGCVDGGGRSPGAVPAPAGFSTEVGRLMCDPWLTHGLPHLPPSIAADSLRDWEPHACRARRAAAPTIRCHALPLPAACPHPSVTLAVNPNALGQTGAERECKGSRPRRRVGPAGTRQSHRSALLPCCCRGASGLCVLLQCADPDPSAHARRCCAARAF